MVDRFPSLLIFCQSFPPSLSDDEMMERRFLPLLPMAMAWILSRSSGFPTSQQRLEDLDSLGRTVFQELGHRSMVSDSSVLQNQVAPSVVSKRVFEKDQRPVVLFDGVCNLCNGAVNLALDWDPKGKLRFAALQSDVGKALLEHAAGRDPDDISSIILVTRTQAYVRSDAILRITEELKPFPVIPLPLGARLTRLVIPRFLRDLIYNGVADNRYSILGKRGSCRCDGDGEFEDRFVPDSIARVDFSSEDDR